MSRNVNVTTTALAAAALFGAIFGAVLAAIELGRWVGARQRRAAPGTADSGLGAMDSAIFGLFGLLLAFTFFGAASRYDQRRDQILAEANAIGTAYRRVDLLPAHAQPGLRGLYRQYVESRLATYRKLSEDVDAARLEYDRSIALQDQIWKASLAAAQGSPAFGLVVGSLNEVYAITRTRWAAIRFHVPGEIIAMLLGLALLSSLVAGRNLSANPHRSWLNVIVYSLVVTGGIFVIIDYELPRLGLIRLDAADQLLVQLLESMR